MRKSSTYAIFSHYCISSCQQLEQWDISLSTRFNKSFLVYVWSCEGYTLKNDLLNLADKDMNVQVVGTYPDQSQTGF